MYKTQILLIFFLFNSYFILWRLNSIKLSHFSSLKVLFFIGKIILFFQLILSSHRWSIVFVYFFWIFSLNRKCTTKIYFIDHHLNVFIFLFLQLFSSFSLSFHVLVRKPLYPIHIWLCSSHIFLQVGFCLLNRLYPTSRWWFWSAQ